MRNGGGFRGGGGRGGDRGVNHCRKGKTGLIVRVTLSLHVLTSGKTPLFTVEIGQTIETRSLENSPCPVGKASPVQSEKAWENGPIPQLAVR